MCSSDGLKFLKIEKRVGFLSAHRLLAEVEQKNLYFIKAHITVNAEYQRGIALYAWIQLTFVCVFQQLLSAVYIKTETDSKLYCLVAGWASVAADYLISVGSFNTRRFYYVTL